MPNPATNRRLLFSGSVLSNPVRSGLVVELMPQNSYSGGTWADSSGSGNNATQGTGANQPTRDGTALNGWPVLVFDGSDDYLTVALALTQPFTFFVVWNRSSNTGSQQLFQGNDATTYEVLLSATTGFILSYAGGGIPGLSGDYHGTPVILSANFNGASSLLAARTATLNQTTTTDPGSSGGSASFNIGIQKAGTLNPYGGYIAELLVYNRAIAGGELSGVTNYLNKKYAVF